MPSILIVDDNPTIRSTIRRLLQNIPDWTVCGEAVDGRDGVTKAQQFRPDFVLLDLSMPVMNGLEAARELKRLVPSAVLVMFTTFDTKDLEREAIAAGVSAVRYKSQPIKALLDTLHTLLETAVTKTALVTAPRGSSGH